MYHSVRRKFTPQEVIDRKHKHDAPKIQEYQTLVSVCFEQRRKRQQDKEALDVTTQLLDQNPENYVYWNIRREIFQGGIFPNLKDVPAFDSKPAVTAIQQKQKLLLDDIHFVLAKLKVFPKTYWLWNHRSWCLNNFPGGDWNAELELVDYLLSKDPRNFHGWHYRRVIVEKLEQLGQYKPKDDGKSLTTHEFKFTTQKINNDFSNFSAWYNRALLIPAYLKELEESDQADSDARKEFLDQEIDYLRQAVYTDPDVSSAWFYHKWLYHNIKLTIFPQIPSSRLVEILKEEIGMVEELSEVEPENSYCLLALVYLRDLLRKVTTEGSEDNSAVEDSNEDRQRTLQVYEKLQEIDPMRRNMYRAWKQAYEQKQLSIVNA